MRIFSTSARWLMIQRALDWTNSSMTEKGTRLAADTTTCPCLFTRRLIYFTSLRMSSYSIGMPSYSMACSSIAKSPFSKDSFPTKVGFYPVFLCYYITQRLKKSRKNGKILPEPTKTEGMRLDLTKQVHAFCFLKYVLLFSQRESRFQIQNPQGLRYSRPLCPLLCRIHSRNWGAIP